ncbi:CRISPR-associated RecB family exonuclease Cas4 [hydrothermal vent metagenome]|uniref:CRISPR-associated exonuclease Cas4 n=1 Tax=hydrothermal vent metagenome TaxID=652676 RepID=A0A1W1DZM4_9ZZZZ
MDGLLIPLAALQHYAFCPRQCALIHNEQVWAENYLTAQGQQLHQRVDSGLPESRNGIRYERAVKVCAPTLGLVGKLDLVEVEIKTKACYPVEYKRGKPKKDNVDCVQLCAQVLCLEEMLETKIKSAALWYWQTRRRQVIEINEKLRNETLLVIQATQQLLTSRSTPKIKYTKKCDSCSLCDLCNPKLTYADKSKKYITTLYEEDKT